MIFEQGLKQLVLDLDANRLSGPGMVMQNNNDPGITSGINGVAGQRTHTS